MAPESRPCKLTKFNWSKAEFPESPFSRLDFESETDQSWTSSPIPSSILTWFEHRDRFRVRFRVLSRETRYFESETPIFHVKPVEISPNFKSQTNFESDSESETGLTLNIETESDSETSLKTRDSAFRVRDERLGKFCFLVKK